MIVDARFAMVKGLGFVAFFVLMLAVACMPLPSAQALKPLQQDEYKVLPIDGELVVNVFFYDLNLELFEARSLRDLLNLVIQTGIIRPTVKSQLHAYGSKEFVPFKFDVKLRFIVPSENVQQEFRNLLRSAVSRTPYQVSQKAIEYAMAYGMPLAWVDQTIRARDALRTFSLLTEKYYPEVAGKYAIFFFCGTPAMGGDRPAVYYTFGQSPDSGAYLADFGINIFGGTWWGRYYYVDLCSYPPSRFYKNFKPIFELSTATEKVTYLATLIDTILDMEFVKSLIYRPRYKIQTLFDIIVIDATVAGVGYDVIVRYFDPEMLAKAFRTLMPYNFFTVRLKEVELKDIPELRQAITHTADGIILNPLKAYEVLERSGVIDKTVSGSVDYIPGIILFTTTTSWVESLGTLGIAIPRPDRPDLPLAATGAIFHEVLIKEGLTPTVIHELGHTLGLRHPHDDFDEYRDTRSSLFGFTYFTETIMSYSNSWIGGLNREQIFADLYPLRTFWSIFDLDNIDRAVVALMLQEYEMNYPEIVSELQRVGLQVRDVPEISEALELAKQLARKAVEEFKNHNYFNRAEFKGLGAQYVSALDYAFMASLLTGNLKKYYVPAVVYETKRLGAQAANLRQTLSDLKAEVEKVRKSIEENQKLLSQRKAELEKLLQENEALNAELQRAQQDVAQVQKLKEEVTRLDSELRRVQTSVKQSEDELAAVTRQNNVLAGVVAVEAVGAAAVVFWIRKKARRKTHPPPPPPPPPLPPTSS